jgi:hypothetical protein
METRARCLICQLTRFARDVRSPEIDERRPHLRRWRPRRGPCRPRRQGGSRFTGANLQACATASSAIGEGGCRLRRERGDGQGHTLRRFRRRIGSDGNGRPGRRHPRRPSGHQRCDRSTGRHVRRPDLPRPLPFEDGSTEEAIPPPEIALCSQRLALPLREPRPTSRGGAGGTIQASGSRFHTPELPPAFSHSMSWPMLMVLSAVLHMS